MRWLTPPPATTAAFSSSLRPGVVLRVSRIRAPVPSTARTKVAVIVATPERRASEVQREALRGEDRLSVPVDPQHRSSLAPDALVGQARQPDAPVERAEHVLGGLEPEDDARLLLRDRRLGASRLRDGRGAGQVAGTDVLGEPASDDGLELAAGGVVHRAGG